MQSQVTNQGKLKRSVIYYLFGCRLVLLVLVFISGTYALFTETQFYRLLYSILPISFLCFVFLGKYLLINKRYLNPGKTISRSYFYLSLIPVLLLHVVELGLIFFKSYLFEDTDFLYVWIAALECALAIYIGYYLSALFALSTADSA